MRRHKAAIIGLAGLVFYVFGVFVFRKAENDWPQSFYSSLQLFTLDDGSGGEVPASGALFQFARFGAAAVSLSAIFALAATVAADARSVVRARLSRGHTIVCGLDVHGRQIVSNLLDRRIRVVGIEANPESLGIRQARERGAAVLIGDATDPKVLYAARVGRARKVIVVCGDHDVNARVISAIIESKKQNRRWRNEVVRVDARAGSAGMERELTSRNIVPGDERVSVEWFHDERISAKAMLSDHVQLLRQAAGTDPIEGFVIAGTGLTSRDLLLDAARQWSSLQKLQTNRDDRLPVAVVAADVASWMNANRKIVRELDLALEVREIAEDPSNSPKLELDQRTVFICEDDATTAMKVATSLESRNRLQGRNWLIPVAGDLRGFEGTLSRPYEDGGVRFIDILDLTCGPAMQNQTVREQLARDNHHVYQRTVPNLPASKPWEALNEEQREGNRDAARHHIEVKVRLAGYHLEPSTGESGVPVTFDVKTIEMLSIEEHKRWHDYKQRGGWRYDQSLGSEGQDEENRKHGDMKDWEELSENVREKDRIFVRALPEMLMAAGFELKRRSLKGRAV